MSTSNDNADIAVLKSEMTNVKETTGRIERKLDDYSGLFVTRNEFSEFKKRWFLSHTLAAFGGAILTVLVTRVIDKVIK